MYFMYSISSDINYYMVLTRGLTLHGYIMGVGTVGLVGVAVTVVIVVVSGAVGPSPSPVHGAP